MKESCKKKKPDGWEREEESDEDLHARTVDRSSRRMDGLMLVYYYCYLLLFYLLLASTLPLPCINQLYPWFSCLHISVSIYVMVVVAFGSAVSVLYSPLPLSLSFYFYSSILYPSTPLLYYYYLFTLYPTFLLHLSHTIYIPRPLAALRSTSHSNNNCCLQF